MRAIVALLLLATLMPVAAAVDVECARPLREGEPARFLRTFAGHAWDCVVVPNGGVVEFVNANAVPAAYVSDDHCFATGIMRGFSTAAITFRFEDPAGDVAASADGACEAASDGRRVFVPFQDAIRGPAFAAVVIVEL